MKIDNTCNTNNISILYYLDLEDNNSNEDLANNLDYCDRTLTKFL